jgi:UPF0716 protein FxsA
MGCLLLLLIFIGLPMTEIEVIKIVAARIGGWDTFFLLIFSAILGSYLAKHQGAVVLSKIQRCMAEGRMPTVEMIDGFLVFLGGILFIFPGFVSDAIGLLLIFPLTRWLIRLIVLAGFKVKASHPQRERPQPTASRVDSHGKTNRSGVVDAEVVE